MMVLNVFYVSGGGSNDTILISQMRATMKSRIKTQDNNGDRSLKKTVFVNGIVIYVFYLSQWFAPFVLYAFIVAL